MGVHDSAGRAKHYLFYNCTSRTPQIDRNTLKPNPQSREVLRPKKTDTRGCFGVGGSRVSLCNLSGWGFWGQGWRSWFEVQGYRI